MLKIKKKKYQTNSSMAFFNESISLTLIAFLDLSILLINPVKTLPGPTSTNGSNPSSI